MKMFQLTVNGQTLHFSEDQIPQMQSALGEAVQNPGTPAVRSGQFGEIRAELDDQVAGHRTIGGSPGKRSMVNSNIQLTDC